MRKILQTEDFLLGTFASNCSRRHDSDEVAGTLGRDLG
jgi:hypothetical protein